MLEVWKRVVICSAEFYPYEQQYIIALIIMLPVTLWSDMRYTVDLLSRTALRTTSPFSKKFHPTSTLSLLVPLPEDQSPARVRSTLVVLLELLLVRSWASPALGDAAYTGDDE
jgi:hypothetical protein